MTEPNDSSDLDVVAIGPRSGLRYVHLDARWADEIEEIELACFPTADPADLYDAAEVRHLAADFPEGCFVGLDGDEPVANGFGVRTDFDLDHPQHNVDEFSERNGTESGHDPLGEWYYGTDIAVRPDHRRMGIGGELYVLRKDVCRRFNLRGIIAGGVIPGFADHKDHMSADEYIVAVRAGELYDRTLSFQLENGFEARCALANYMRDPAVDNYAALIVWHNPDHLPSESSA
jgi:GNAT superfamily N-acetyltransferase